MHVFNTTELYTTKMVKMVNFTCISQFKKIKMGEKSPYRVYMIWLLPLSPTSFHTFFPLLTALQAHCPSFSPSNTPNSFLTALCTDLHIGGPSCHSKLNFYFTSSERPSPIHSLPSNFPQHIYHNPGHCQSPSYECKLQEKDFVALTH